MYSPYLMPYIVGHPPCKLYLLIVPSLQDLISRCVPVPHLKPLYFETHLPESFHFPKVLGRFGVVGSILLFVIVDSDAKIPKNIF